MHILANISKSKGNQTIKVGQLIECNIRNIFLEKSYIKCGWETSPKPFSEILKLIMNFEVKLVSNQAVFATRPTSETKT